MYSKEPKGDLESWLGNTDLEYATLWFSLVTCSLALSSLLPFIELEQGELEGLLLIGPPFQLFQIPNLYFIFK